jgi:mRNA interferase HigB
MKNIVSRKKLRDFWEKYPDSEETLKTWYKVAIKADWAFSNNIKIQYRNASIVGNNRVVFNICGNKYRLIVKFNYEMQWGWIRFIGTHSDYDRINAAEI